MCVTYIDTCVQPLAPELEGCKRQYKNFTRCPNYPPISPKHRHTTESRPVVCEWCYERLRATKPYGHAARLQKRFEKKYGAWTYCEALEMVRKGRKDSRVTCSNAKIRDNAIDVETNNKQQEEQVVQAVKRKHWSSAKDIVRQNRGRSSVSFEKVDKEALVVACAIERHGLASKRFGGDLMEKYFPGAAERKKKHEKGARTTASHLEVAKKTTSYSVASRKKEHRPGAVKKNQQ
ncbi:MAG: hypothetical protein M1828_004467 [Chrysothrix sp. TS-e1954]|nr:MAG: hypothetical protein M1828_004467 [Chrysothrix sp. TS-e1954]